MGRFPKPLGVNSTGQVLVMDLAEGGALHQERQSWGRDGVTVGRMGCLGGHFELEVPLNVPQEVLSKQLGIWMESSGGGVRGEVQTEAINL